MKINQLSYYESNQKWKFENINFADFNLLVGVSGVGKSKIINAIINLQHIVNGISLNDVKWDLKFTSDGENFRWQGEFENDQAIDILLPGKSGFKIISEYLYKEDIAVIERNRNEIKFNGNLIPKLSPFQSVVSILYTEESILPFHKGMWRIFKHDTVGKFLAPKNFYNSIINEIRKFANKPVNDSFTQEDFGLVLQFIGKNNFPVAYRIIFVYDN